MLFVYVKHYRRIVISKQINEQAYVTKSYFAIVCELNLLWRQAEKTIY